jgi:hypothetical protein
VRRASCCALLLLLTADLCSAVCRFCRLASSAVCRAVCADIGIGTAIGTAIGLKAVLVRASVASGFFYFYGLCLQLLSGLPLAFVFVLVLVPFLPSAFFVCWLNCVCFFWRVDQPSPRVSRYPGPVPGGCLPRANKSAFIWLYFQSAEGHSRILFQRVGFLIPVPFSF